MSKRYMTDLVQCTRCKKQVSSSTCWSVHNKGEKTFECKDTTCKDTTCTATLPPLNQLILLPTSIWKSETNRSFVSRMLAGCCFGKGEEKTRFYIHPWTDLIWKNTANIWTRATDDEVKFLLPRYLAWEEKRYVNRVYE